MSLRLRDAILLALLAAWVALLAFCTPIEAASFGEVVPVRMQVTAYCLRGYTYSGVPVSHGATAAHRSVPLYTRYYVPGYGHSTILDRGEMSIDQLDVWVPSCDYAIRTWGRRWITVWRVVG
jgi:3D (Asp-Asp-Asp) domain-containing protein